MTRATFLAVLLAPLLLGGAATRAAGLTFACDEANDAYCCALRAGAKCARFASPAEAIAAAEEGSGVLLLADQYPAATVDVEPRLWERVRAKRLRVYVEYPQGVPGVELGAAKSAAWERVCSPRTKGHELRGAIDVRRRSTDTDRGHGPDPDRACHRAVHVVRQRHRATPLVRWCRDRCSRR